jgi:hypothetical protein
VLETAKKESFGTFLIEIDSRIVELTNSKVFEIKLKIFQLQNSKFWIVKM